MEADDIGSKLLVGFHCEYRRVMAEHHQSYPVLSQHISCNGAVSGLPQGIDCAKNICILKDVHINT